METDVGVDPKWLAKHFEEQEDEMSDYKQTRDAADEKIILGATRGRFEDTEFDVVDNILNLVKNYHDNIKLLQEKAAANIAKIENDLQLAIIAEKEKLKRVLK